jgi:hypothetical protein
MQDIGEDYATRARSFEQRCSIWSNTEKNVAVAGKFASDSRRFNQEYAQKWTGIQPARAVQLSNTNSAPGTMVTCERLLPPSQTDMVKGSRIE